MTTRTEVNEMIRGMQSAPTYTVGGEPDEQSTSVRMTRFMQAEARARSGEVDVNEVMTTGDTGEGQ